jgi:hypothetical protein
VVQSGTQIKTQLTLQAITDTLLSESSSQLELSNALRQFANTCTDITGITPDRTFLGWSDDIHLSSGVAINPQAAAHCVNDYGRSVAFIRGVHAAIKALQTRFPGQALNVLYAGCGPFATLIMAVLERFRYEPMILNFLDIHASSLESVGRLIAHFGFDTQTINLLNADATGYQHTDAPQLIIVETMQKALEQEPQVAVTANLAPQLGLGGVFIPERITVELGLADLSGEAADIDRGGCGIACPRHLLGTMLELSAATTTAAETLNLGTFTVPQLDDLAQLDLAMFTHIHVFSHYQVHDYDSEITLPLKCHDVKALCGGDQLQVSYALGPYPKFCVSRAH